MINPIKVQWSHAPMVPSRSHPPDWPTWRPAALFGDSAAWAAPKRRPGSSSKTPEIGHDTGFNDWMNYILKNDSLNSLWNLFMIGKNIQPCAKLERGLYLWYINLYLYTLYGSLWGVINQLMTGMDDTGWWLGFPAHGLWQYPNRGLAALIWSSQRFCPVWGPPPRKQVVHHIFSPYLPGVQDMFWHLCGGRPLSESSARSTLVYVPRNSVAYIFNTQMAIVRLASCDSWDDPPNTVFLLLAFYSAVFGGRETIGRTRENSMII